MLFRDAGFDNKITPVLKSATEIFSKIDHNKWINADIESIESETAEYLKSHPRFEET